MRARRASIVAALMITPCLSGCIAAVVPALAGASMVGAGKDREASSEEAEAEAAASARPIDMATGGSVGEGSEEEPNEAPILEPSEPVSEPVRQLAPANDFSVGPPAPSTSPAKAVRVTPVFRFLEYATEQARGAGSPQRMRSAMLENAAALDGKRTVCRSSLPLVLVDLDPKGAKFAPDDIITPDPELVAALQSLRDQEIGIAWISDNDATQANAIRKALSESGLDPEARDRLVLLRKPDDRKQTRRKDLAKGHCIIAIAGDKRGDFDELFDYLLKPESASPLEPMFGNGWFMIPSVVSKGEE